MSFWDSKSWVLLIFGRGISWATKEKVQQANYFGSLTQASTIRVGSFNGEEIYAPFKSLLPMVLTLFFSFLKFFLGGMGCGGGIEDYKVGNRILTNRKVL